MAVERARSGAQAHGAPALRSAPWLPRARENRYRTSTVWMASTSCQRAEGAV
jgi:hypothetical protein